MNWLKKRGVDGVGIADIMKEAGLTQGASSGHFSSKEELLREAIDDGFRRTPFMPPGQTGEPLDTLIRGYLSSKHRDDLRNACLTGTLTAEMAGHPRRTRERFISNLEKVFATIDSKLPSGGSAPERKKQAMAVFALLVGALQLDAGYLWNPRLSRFTTFPAFSDVTRLGPVRIMSFFRIEPYLM
jgi:TetR/AcrR family transcriptional repressor of nem operon